MALYTGIEFEVGFDAEYTCVVERDTAVGFGTAVVIAYLTGGTQHYTDPLPVSSTDYYYRAKNTRDGFADSSYSATLGPYKPVVLV